MTLFILTLFQLKLEVRQSVWVVSCMTWQSQRHTISNIAVFIVHLQLIVSMTVFLFYHISVNTQVTFITSLLQVPVWADLHSHK